MKVIRGHISKRIVMYTQLMYTLFVPTGRCPVYTGRVDIAVGYSLDCTFASRGVTRTR